MTTEEYIAENIGKTVKTGKEGLLPFTVPGIGDMFRDFYYWDTYFANLALLALGDTVQASNNVANMKTFAETLGYIPNSDITPDRSQPPLFARSVYDLYVHTGKDTAFAREYLPALKAEHAFWMRERILPCGLNGYGHNAVVSACETFCRDISLRVGISDAYYTDKATQGGHFLAIAESGWDFTPRFRRGDNRYAGMGFASVDLNAILYDAEKIIARLSEDTGDAEEAKSYTALAETRAARMRALMTGEDGLPYDYDAVTERKSALRHAGMFVPFAVGLLRDGKAANALLAALERSHGVAACEERAGDTYDQWDYPAMWAPNIYFCVEGLRRSGSDAYVRVARKYIATVDDVFQKTGTLWEKYDAVTGDVAGGSEYGTPPMMGWTAGVYLWIKNLLRNANREDTYA